MALAWLAPSAFAIGLGEIDVRSAPGQALDAAIPVDIAAGEAVHAGCFSVSRTDGPAAALWSDATIELRRSAHGAHLLLRTIVALHPRTLALRVAFGCNGARESRDYRIDLGAPRAAASSGTIAQLPARAGDSITSLTRLIFPDDASAQRDYARALRAANPMLLGRAADDAPIPPGSEIALPDLRRFARSIRGAVPPARPGERHLAADARHSARPASAASSISTRPATSVPPATAKRQATARTPPIESAASPPNVASRDGFALKLSGPVLDLSPSRGVGERERAALRERLRVLESDDAVAAMLEMRHRVEQLQARVDALQLKLASMPAAGAPRVEATPRAVATAVSAPVPMPAATTSPKFATRAAEQTPQPDVAKPRSAPPEAASRARVASQGATAMSPPHGESSRLASALGALRQPGPLAAPGAVLALLLALWLLRHRRHGAIDDFATEEPDAAERASLQQASQSPAEAQREPRSMPPPAEDPEESRRRYIAERFPEVASGTIDLDDAESVVKGARLFYQDGAAASAIELLQLARDRHPDAVGPWLALFEIYRREHLIAEFDQLASHFRERHGERPEWRKVRYFGASIDPDNPLYQDESAPDAVESLGLAIDAQPDPAEEDWLGAGANAEQEALGQSMRTSVMAAAAVREEDLAPNPIPALRKVEVFNVA